MHAPYANSNEAIITCIPASIVKFNTYAGNFSASINPRTLSMLSHSIENHMTVFISPETDHISIKNLDFCATN